MYLCMYVYVCVVLKSLSDACWSLQILCLSFALQCRPTNTICNAIDNRRTMNTTQGQPPNSAEQNYVVWSWVAWT